MRRRKRYVRLHLEGTDTSLDGIFVGFWAGHYVLRTPEALVEQGKTEVLDGRDVKVPRSRVLFMQELTATTT